MTIPRLCLLATFLFGFTLTMKLIQAEIPSSQLPLEARDDTSLEDEFISTSYVLPNQIFNDGKPYYAGKDPISGQFDFSAKKPAGIEPENNEVIHDDEKIVLNRGTPNIHDFLNLPVKYSSSKFVYPLVSSSYANLKYQGSNKNYITNKKPTSVAVLGTVAPNYAGQSYYAQPTTKLVPVSPTTPGLVASSTASTSTKTVTSKKPTTSSTMQSTTTKPSTKTTTKKISSPSTTPTKTSASTPKYTTSTRKPIPISTTTPTPKTNTTRKKFVPTKKYSPTTTPASVTTTTFRFPSEGTKAPVKPISSTTEGKPSTTASSTRPSTPVPSTTTQAVVFTENPAASSSFSPLPGTTRIPDLDPAEIYHTLGQKHQNEKTPKPSMTLADLFNSLADEESAVASNYQNNNQGFDAQGNLIEPIAPSKPAPFAMQGPQVTAKPSSNSNKNSMKNVLQQESQGPGPVQNSEHVSSGTEYVSYQVGQPNVMQYRPIPGAINNVVISPGQNSASFVLGSQQQVGTNAFGLVEKEPLFSKPSGVQYGQVISEDINTLSRPQAPPGFQQMPLPSSSNFHQNGSPTGSNNYPQANPSNFHQSGSPQTQSQTGYSEEAPAAPSPYQQLPMFDFNGKPMKQMQQNFNSKPLEQQSQQQHSSSQHAGPQLLPQAPPNTQPQHFQQATHLENSNNQNLDTKELLVSTNIRFPVNEEQSEELPTGPLVSGPPLGPHINGHAQPLSLQQIQNSNQVVFPKPNEEKDSLTGAVTQNEDVQIQKHEVLTINQHKQKLNFPTGQDQSAPSQHMTPPPRFPTNVPNSLMDSSDMHKRPQNNRPGPSYAFNDFTRKPTQGFNRPNPDRLLPNILPQFRPNAKLSSGHPTNTNFNQEPGNIRVHGVGPYKRPNGMPQFSHRRQPLMQNHGPQRLPANHISEYPSGPPPPLPNDMNNRRVYRLPPYGGQNIQYLDRMYMHRPMPHVIQNNGNFIAERHAAQSSNLDPYKLLPEGLTPSDFEEEDLVINDPPQPVTPNKEAQNIGMPKLEPVVTLQMLQSQKKTLSSPNEDTGAGEIQVPALTENEDSNDEKLNAQSGLYVVYPMKGDKKDAIETAETKVSLPAVAHVEPPSGSEYQNTPFSVIRDQPQEPILKNKKPQSLQQHHKLQRVKDTFPYPIEKPDPSFTELNGEQKKVPGILISPRISNGAYATGTATPIAIAYTPTEPNPYKRSSEETLTNKYSTVNLASSVISEIRSESQTEQALNNDFDSRGQNLEKDFMAPFYPSVSLGSAVNANAASNGWNIVDSSTEKTFYEKNKIDRSDVNEEDRDNFESSTKSMDMDKFEPELQGGFKPIYPPGYKFEQEEEALSQANENPEALALASRMNTPNGHASPSGPILSTSTSTTFKPVNEKGSSKEESETKTESLITTLKPSTSTSISISSSSSKDENTNKRKPSISLASLLFGDDEDFDEENGARSKPNDPLPPQALVQSPPTVQASNSKVGPRTIPRMGPRSLKLN